MKTEKEQQEEALRAMDGEWVELTIPCADGGVFKKKIWRIKAG